MLWAILELPPRPARPRLALLAKVRAPHAPAAMLAFIAEHPEHRANGRVFARPWARRYPDSAQRLLESYARHDRKAASQRGAIAAKVARRQPAPAEGPEIVAERRHDLGVDLPPAISERS